MNSYRISAAIALLCISICTAYGADFEFAWVTDTHITTTNPIEKNYEHSVRLREVLADITTLAPDFILHGGDAIEKPGDPAELAAFLELMQPGVPWYPIAGNHDIGNQPTPKALDGWIGSGLGRGLQKREFYGFTHKGAAIYVLNTFVNESTRTEMMARAEEQLKDMDEFFQQNQAASPKIVCGHAPLFVREADEPNEYFNVKMPYRERLIKLMLMHGATTYLCGHRHGDYVIESGGIREYCQTALSFQIGESNRPGCYMFHVGDGAIERKFHPLDLQRTAAKLPAAATAN
jgi:serine/threonine-protein phosphatase CPPED1